MKLSLEYPQLSSLRGLKELLERQGLYYDDNTINVVYSVLKQNKKVRAIMLKGPPGVGKTAMTEALARIMNAEYVFYQCTLGTSEDDLLYKLLPSEKTTSGIEKILGALPEALIKSRERPTILVLDEFDKTRPSADALLLDFLQNCRVSVRISSEEKIIRGNPENLIVFLTSNEEREFSEPLLRRVVVINIPPLPTITVYNIMLKYFDEKLATLLAQIYDDTIKAGLRKPATIQELIQLGNAIKELGESADLQILLRSYVIKYDDDWSKYLEYIRNREPYQWLPNNEEDEEKITQYYDAKQEVVAISPVQQHEEQKDMPKRIPKVVLKLPTIDSVDKEKKDEDIVEEYGVTPSDVDHYDAIIKTFIPPPPEMPTFLESSASIYKDYIKIKPLSYYDIVNTRREVLDKLFSNSDILIKIKCSTIDYRELVRRVRELDDTKIVYYSKSLIRLKTEYNSFSKSYEIDIAIIEPLSEKPAIEVVARNAPTDSVISMINIVLGSQRKYIELINNIDNIRSEIVKELEKLIERLVQQGKYDGHYILSDARDDAMNIIVSIITKMDFGFTAPIGENPLKILNKEPEIAGRDRSINLGRKYEDNIIVITADDNGVVLRLKSFEVK